MLIRTVPSAVGLHLLSDTGLNKATGATEELRTQNNESDPFLSSDNVSLSRQEHPFHLGYISPFKNHAPSVDEIKQKAQGIKENSTSLKMKKKLLKRKQGFKVKNLTGFCTENVVYQLLNVKEWQALSPLLPLPKQ